MVRVNTNSLKVEERWPVPSCESPHGISVDSRAGRIFTGAVVPEGADTVMMQEDCEVIGDRVLIQPPIIADLKINGEICGVQAECFNRRQGYR